MEHQLQHDPRKQDSVTDHSEESQRTECWNWERRCRVQLFVEEWTSWSGNRGPEGKSRKNQPINFPVWGFMMHSVTRYQSAPSADGAQCLLGNAAGWTSDSGAKGKQKHVPVQAGEKKPRHVRFISVLLIACWQQESKTSEVAQKGKEHKPAKAADFVLEFQLLVTGIIKISLCDLGDNHWWRLMFP